MAPLRNAQQISWETAFTFEHAMNTIDDIADENELFVYPLDEKAEQLLSLVELAKRQIIGAWIGKFPSPADEKALRSLVETCHTTLPVRGDALVRTQRVDELAGIDTASLQKLGYEGLISVMQDGICEWLLRGRTRDVRACLWDGALFQADRANAVFCRASCRTAYHRALATAAGSNKTPGELLGFFHCAECKRDLLINATSGLIRDRKRIYIGRAIDYEPICYTCANANHSEWTDYIVPMSAAA